MKVAIIGAGVSGLSLAYYLYKLSNAQQQKIDITVYEQCDRIGGNAFTQELDLKPLNRTPTWVDMGVNDFNINTYKAMLELWEEIGLPQEEYVGTLVNETSFFNYGATPKDTYGFKISNQGNVSVYNIEKPNIEKKLADGFKQLEKSLNQWYKQHDRDHSAFNITVEQFIQMYFQDERYEDFVNLALLPRINAMYFTYEESYVGRPPVLDMPMWLVSHYYILQEGFASNNECNNNSEPKEKERKFFKQGCQKWLEFLAQKLEKEYKVNIELGVNGIKITRFGGGAYLYYNGMSSYYDKVVFCTPAYEVERITDVKTFAADELLQKTQQFPYVPCIVYVNHDSSQVPPVADYVCAYNVRIYNYNSYYLQPDKTNNKAKWPVIGSPSAMFKPYHMTYSANKHQPELGHDTETDFYISVNPLNVDRKFLDQTLNQTNGALAKASFLHCKFTKTALDAQEYIQTSQIGQWNPQQDKSGKFRPVPPRTFYLAGNYCNGAGLHTECILFSKDLAQKIIDPNFVSENFYDRQGTTGRHPAPAYMREALGHY